MGTEKGEGDRGKEKQERGSPDMEGQTATNKYLTPEAVHATMTLSHTTCLPPFAAVKCPFACVPFWMEDVHNIQKCKCTKQEIRFFFLFTPFIFFVKIIWLIFSFREG